MIYTETNRYTDLLTTLTMSQQHSRFQAWKPLQRMTTYIIKKSCSML